MLFKFRGQIPLVFFLLAIPGIYASHFQTIERLNWLEWTLFSFGVFVSLFGLIFRFIAVGTSSKHTSGRNTWGQEAKVLNTTGLYSIVRHPLYFANFLIWIGIVVFVGNPWFLVVFGLLFWLYYERIMYTEEQFLEREFGEEYVEWSNKVPAFIPKFSNYRGAENTFSLRTILRREYPGISAMIISFVFVDFVREWFAACEPNWKWIHAVWILIALFYSLVMRTLKHHTSVLNEEDRS